MAVKLNAEALEQAKRLLDEGQYAINTVWKTNEPNAEAENGYLEKHSLDDYAKWYLAVDTDQNADAKSAHKFPYGDFRRVHRSGVSAAKQRAQQAGHPEIAAAADELLDLFDRINAC